jgi:hypothetical protein
VTNLEESLCDYYAAKADQLVLTDRVFDMSTESEGATVSYISMGPEPRRRTPMLLAAAASIALLAGAGVAVSRTGGTARNPSVISNATVTSATVVTCSISDTGSAGVVTETACSKLTAPPLWPADVPAGLSLSKIDESVGNNGNSRWHVLQYSGATTDGFIGQIRVVMETGASIDSIASLDLPDSENIGSREFSLDETFLRGTRGTISQELNRKNPVIAMSWRERPDLLVSIEANSTSLADLTLMAESLTPITPEMFATLISGGTFVLAAGTNLQGYVDPNAATTTTASR